MIYYLTKHQEIKKKLMQEILPSLELVKDNFVDGLVYDTVMEFDYLRQIFYETLRIEPPASFSVN